MTLTEEEAKKTKRCQESFGPPATPMQMSYTVGVGIAAHTAPLMCLGSACMAWRWVQIIGGDGFTPMDTDKGYCGKAGKP